MAGIAAGLGALGEGFVRGIRIGSDLTDADTRRGLVDMQKKQAQLALDRDTQMADLSKQLGQEFVDYRDGTGAYAPAEGQQYDRTSPQSADLHYSRIQPLLQQQAILSGKNPAMVDKELKELRKEGYAERVFQASQLMESGDVEGGAKILQPLYRKMFADGTDVKSVAYDKTKDALSMVTVRDGQESVVEMPRGKVVDMLNYGALNPADAVKLKMREKEKQADRDFESGQTDKKLKAEAEQRGLDRKSREAISAADNASAERRTGISAEATRYSADRSVEARRNAGANARDDKDYDDFQTQINDALGWNKNNPLVTPEQLQSRNRDAAAMTNIWNTTRDVGGKKLSAYEVAQVIRGIEGKTAKYAEKDGYTIVDVGGIRAVLPK